MNLLLIEDARQLADSIAAMLAKYDYFVDIQSDGLSGEEYARSGIYDAIILDIRLPKKSGLDVLRSLRQARVETPVLLLTAKSKVSDKIEGLDAGADDYLCKPFAPGELLARLRAITRRRGDFQPDMLIVGETSLDKLTHRLFRGGLSVNLSSKECRVLEILMQNIERIVPKEQFIEKVWGFNAEVEYNTIEVYMTFVRRKLLAVKSDTRVRSVRGTGYILEIIK